jgi:hypothetical protein
MGFVGFKPKTFCGCGSGTFPITSLISPPLPLNHPDHENISKWEGGRINTPAFKLSKSYRVSMEALFDGIGIINE